MSNLKKHLFYFRHEEANSFLPRGNEFINFSSRGLSLFVRPTTVLVFYSQSDREIKKGFVCNYEQIKKDLFVIANK